VHHEVKGALSRLSPVSKHGTNAERQRFDIARDHELDAKHPHAPGESVARLPNLHDSRLGQSTIQIDRR
jgi:hypothetical protein